MSDRPSVLLLGFGEQHDALAGRLLLLGFRPVRAGSVDAALEAFDKPADLRAALFPVSDEPPGLLAGLSRIAERAGGLGIRFVAAGGRPGTQRIAELRRAGATLCIWEPFNDSELRFVINSAVYDRTRGDVRGVLRVPTRIMARVLTPSGLERPAFVYNLSTGGAYLETPRPVSGGQVSVKIPLPTGELMLPSRIVTTNVPGNLQKGNLPMGMGVSFVDVTPDSLEAITKFVDDRLHAYEL